MQIGSITINDVYTTLVWIYSDTTYMKTIDILNNLPPYLYSTIRQVRVYHNLVHINIIHYLDEIHLNSGYNIESIKYITESLHNHPKRVMDFSKFINLDELCINGLYLEELILPNRLTTLSISYSKIEKMNITPQLYKLYIYASPGTFNIISSRLPQIRQLNLNAEHITTLDILNIFTLRAYKCKIDRIINIEPHFNYKEHFIFDILQCDTPYKLNQHNYLNTHNSENTTYNNLMNIKKTNTLVEFTELMVRCRINIFNSDTHIVNMSEKNIDDISPIYIAFRLGSNYQKRCISYI